MSDPLDEDFDFRRTTADKQEDSVEDAFGGDYSEGTLEFLRSFDKPVENEEVPSLDPLDVPTDYAELDLPLTPKLYQAAYAAADELLRDIEESKSFKLDPETKAQIDHRRSLVERTTPEESQWLKLKAYHRALDLIQADVEGSQAALTSGPTSTSCATRLVWTGYPDSEESEWSPDWRHTGYLPYHGATSLSTSASTSTAGQQQNLSVGQSVADQDHQPRDVEVVPFIEYTPAYLEKRRLQGILAKQQRQRTQAFVVSFAVAVGICTLKWLRRKAKKEKPGSLDASQLGRSGSVSASQP